MIAPPRECPYIVEVLVDGEWQPHGRARGQVTFWKSDSDAARSAQRLSKRHGRTRVRDTAWHEGLGSWGIQAVKVEYEKGHRVGGAWGPSNR